MIIKKKMLKNNVRIKKFSKCMRETIFLTLKIYKKREIISLPIGKTCY